MKNAVVLLKEAVRLPMGGAMKRTPMLMKGMIGMTGTSTMKMTDLLLIIMRKERKATMKTRMNTVKMKKKTTGPIPVTKKKMKKTMMKMKVAATE